MHLALLVVMSLLSVSQAPAPGKPSPNIERVGLGKERTIILVLASDCQPCRDAIDFYKTLLSLPGMDGVQKRMVVLATDGVWPVGKALDALGFKPHRLTSYPRLVNTLEISDQAPGIMVVDATGIRLGLWTGALSPAQEKEVLASVTGNPVIGTGNRSPMTDHR